MSVDSQILSNYVTNIGLNDCDKTLNAKAHTGDSKRIIDKALSLLRLLKLKLPEGSLRKAESCRALIAVELAVRSLGISFDRSKITSVCPISESEYKKGLVTSKQILGLEFLSSNNVIDILCIKYGGSSCSTALKAEAQNILRKYQKKYVSKLNLDQQKFVNLDSQIYQAAAFFVAAKQAKVR